MIYPKYSLNVLLVHDFYRETETIGFFSSCSSEIVKVSHQKLKSQCLKRTFTTVVLTHLGIIKIKKFITHFGDTALGSVMLKKNKTTKQMLYIHSKMKQA